MRKKLSKAVTIILITVILTGVFSSSALAAGSAEKNGRIITDTSAEKIYLSPKGISSKLITSYRKVTLYINGRTATYSARLIGGEIYLPVRKIAEGMTGARVTYDSKTKTLSVGGGYNVSVTDGAYVLYAQGRPLFATTPSVILSDGAMYAPASTIAKAIGVSFYKTSDGAASISGAAAPIASASKFYREDEIYWLARIINAESRGESLLGQIAAGNVVLNRVKSSQYPNTIWGVIFDRKYGVQFSPVLDGSIYSEPTYTAILAAKIVLEGFRISDTTLFFLYPQASTSSWIPKNRKYEFSIGKHDFYS